MTKREKLVLSAYTGVLMCDFEDLHQYIEEVLERPVFTHEMATENFHQELKARTKQEFLDVIGEERNGST